MTDRAVPPEGRRESFERTGTLFTFYSFKGGVGRSMCLANVAAILAANDRKVLIVDWDLEAPGIERYFLNPPSRIKDKRQVKAGLVELMDSLGGAKPLNWRNCLVTVYPFGTSRALSILPSGNQDPGYPSRVQGLNWEKLFRENRLGESLEQLREEWLLEYDFVFVDSRTGFTDAGNICTIHLPDVLVLLFTTNEQSLTGVIDVARRARIVRNELPYDRKKLVVIPVPSRDETQSQHNEALEWRAKFAKQLREFYSDWAPQGTSAEDILETLRIPYKAWWSFGERLPVAEGGVKDHLDVGYAYNVLAKLIQSGIDWSAVFGLERSEATEQERLARLILTAQKGMDLLLLEEARAARSLLLRLVFVARPDEGISDSRRWVSDSELAKGEALVLPKLIDAGLIQHDAKERRIQLKEGGLVEEWPLLKGWIAEGRSQLLLRQDLRKREGRLLTTDELRGVDELKVNGLELGPEEEAIVRKSRTRLRRLAIAKTVVSVVFLMVFLGLLFAGFVDFRREQARRRASAYNTAAASLMSDESMAPFAALLRFRARERAVDETYPEVAAWQQLQGDMVRLTRNVNVPSEVTWAGHEAAGFRIEAVAGKMPAIRVVDTVTGQVAFPITHGAAIETAALSSDGRFIRVTGGGKTLVWRGPLFDEIMQLAHPSLVWGLEFSPDGKRLAVSSANVRIWSVPEGKEMLRLQTSGMIRSLAYNPRGDRIATVGWDRAITIWDANTGTKLSEWKSSRPQLSVTWSHDGWMLAAGGEDGLVRLYRLDAKSPDMTLRFGSTVNTVVFSADGKIVTAGGLDGHMRSWDTNRGELKADRDVGIGATRIVETTYWSLVAGWGGLLYLSSGQPQKFLGLPLIDMTVQKDDLVAAAPNRLFPIMLERTGYGVGYTRNPAPKHPSGARSIVFSRDGSLLATGGNDRVVRVWTGQNWKGPFTDPCVVVPRNLTSEEWKATIPSEPYERLCPDLP